MAPGQTALFKWDGVVAGDIGDVFKFCNEVTGQDYDDTVVSSNTDCDELTVIDPNDCGGCGPGDGDELILRDDLFGKPRIFMHFPNPIGDENYDNPPDLPNRGIWSVNIANPTELPITVSKVVIIATSPTTGASDKIFLELCEVSVTDIHTKPATISPTTDEWYCPVSNQLVWENIDNPQTIGPRDAFSFKVRIGGDVIGSPGSKSLLGL